MLRNGGAATCCLPNWPSRLPSLPIRGDDHEKSRVCYWLPVPSSGGQVGIRLLQLD